MRWDEHERWATLCDGDNRLARLYRENYYEKWVVRLLNSEDCIDLDPSLTWEEAKLVVQTLVGAQLS